MEKDINMLDFAPTPSIIQPVVFVLDGSGSMTWSGVTGKSKAVEVRDALVDMINHIKNDRERPELSRVIYVQMIAFSSDKQIKVILDDFTPLYNVDVNLIKPPTEYWSEPDGTCIYCGLKKAEEELQRFISEKELDTSRAYRSTIILLSDGCENFDQSKLLSVAEDIRGKRYLAVVQYGRLEGKANDPSESEVCPEILKNIASSIEGADMNRAKNKMKKMGIPEDEVTKIFIGGKLYTEALDEKAAKVFFIGASTLNLLLGPKAR